MSSAPVVEPSSIAFTDLRAGLNTFFGSVETITGKWTGPLEMLLDEAWLLECSEVTGNIAVVYMDYIGSPNDGLVVALVGRDVAINVKPVESHLDLTLYRSIMALIYHLEP